MENATEALKMAFAVLVFVIALTISFMLITQSRSTADFIFTAKDDQEYVENVTSIGQQTGESYRVVSIDTIIPTIYRYAQENYGVIIIDGNNIVAIYDLVVENTVSKYASTWDLTDSSNELTKLCIGYAPDSKEGIANYIEGATGIVINDVREYQKLFGKIRSNGTIEENGIFTIKEPNSIQCPWTSSTFNIMQRIKVDMEGTNSSHEFGNGTLKYSGAFGTDGFINKYKDASFKEYYYSVKTINNLTEEEEIDRLQIIYVKE